MTATPEILRCPLCQVSIESNGGALDAVQFSNGPKGTRSKLWSRVCQYLKTPDQQRQCINQDPELRGAEQKGDAFPDAPSIVLPKT